MSAADIDWLLELLSGLGPVTGRRMFGGHGIYHDGQMFALVADQRLYLKVDALTEPAFREAGCEAFVYTGGGRSIAMRYWSVPDEAMDSPEAMLPWARRAWQAALRNPTARKAGKPSAGKRR